MNDVSNGDRTAIERDANERMRELGRRSGEARRRKAEAKQTAELEPVGDREQAKVALRRALAGNNMAAVVASAKALIEFDQSPEQGPMTTKDARLELAARIDEIDARRRDHANVCAACGGRGTIPHTPPTGRVKGDGGGIGAVLGSPVGPEQISGVSARVVDEPQGAVRVVSSEDDVA